MARRRPTEPTANPARGAVLVAVAVVIGLFLLRNGIDSSTTVSTDRGDAQTDAGADAGATDGGSTTSTTVSVRPRAEVRVIVLNNSGVTGAAARYSGALQTAGYVLVDENGADSTLAGDSAATQVLFTDGFDAEAASLAEEIGAPSAGVLALGTESPGPVGDANVVVVLGTDLASSTPTIPPA